MKEQFRGDINFSFPCVGPEVVRLAWGLHLVPSKSHGLNVSTESRLAGTNRAWIFPHVTRNAAPEQAILRGFAEVYIGSASVVPLRQ